MKAFLLDWFAASVAIPLAILGAVVFLAAVFYTCLGPFVVIGTLVHGEWAWSAGLAVVWFACLGFWSATDRRAL